MPALSHVFEAKEFKFRDWRRRIRGQTPGVMPTIWRAFFDQQHRFITKGLLGVCRCRGRLVALPLTRVGCNRFAVSIAGKSFIVPIAPRFVSLRDEPSEVGQGVDDAGVSGGPSRHCR